MPAAPHPWLGGNYARLLASLCLVGALYPLVGERRIGQIIWTVAFWLVLYFGQSAVLAHPRARAALRALAVLALVSGIAMISIAAPVEVLALPYAAANTAFLLATTCVILADVVAGRQVDGNRIVGAICVYLLIGMTFGFAYLLLHAAGEPVVAGLDPAQASFAASYLYFSFSTLTTLGYGDLAPEGRFAQLLAPTEAVIGQIYLTILVARLVGLHISQQPAAPRRPDEP